MGSTSLTTLKFLPTTYWPHNITLFCISGVTITQVDGFVKETVTMPCLYCWAKSCSLYSVTFMQFGNPKVPACSRWDGNKTDVTLVIPLLPPVKYKTQPPSLQRRRVSALNSRPPSWMGEPRKPWMSTTEWPRVLGLRWLENGGGGGGGRFFSFFYSLPPPPPPFSLVRQSLQFTWTKMDAETIEWVCPLPTKTPVLQANNLLV